MKNEKYVACCIDVMIFDCKDVITTSGFDGEEDPIENLAEE